jgi:formate dehydrogenase maturation protein FdhE
VKAEAREACKTYLKISVHEQAAATGRVATLALDVLMAEEGYVRTGVNFFLLTADQDPIDRNTYRNT